MKKLLLSLIFLCLVTGLFSQDYFRGEFNKEKKNVILMNPTAGNIEVVNFLVANRLLDLDTGKVSFVGIYHPSQKYDFSASVEYIGKNDLSNFFLHEVRGDISEESLFRGNACTEDFKTIFRNSVGVIFFGGADIPPSVYGEENLYSVVNDPGRHYFEISFLFHLTGSSRNPSFVPLLAENPLYLVTGFCLGMQTMNVVSGGTLYQDIPVQIYNSHNDESNLKTGRSNLHRNYWQNISKDPDLMGSNVHPVKFTDNTFFCKRVGVSKKMMPLIYSSHHQAVNKIGDGLEVTALSPDGKVVEGLVHKIYPNVFSVQFHPEVSSLYVNRGKLKFSPEDNPITLHEMLDNESLRFHQKYWHFISEIIEKNIRQIK